MFAIIKKYFLLFLSLLVNLWLIVSNEKVYLDNIMYSTTMVLLDNKIVDVSQNGIHFFDEQFQNEEPSHFIQFSENLNQYTDDFFKISMSQFSNEYGEYILILCKRIIYIFDKKHNLIININLDESIGDIDNKIIAYKKENDYLYYIITSMDSTYYNIIPFKFDLNSNQTEILTENQIVMESKIYKYAFYCLFMAPSSFSSINNDVLNCFYISYSSWPVQLKSTSYDPEQNFKEIESLKYNIEFDCFAGDPLFFGAITNKEKSKTLLYMLHNTSPPAWATFDYINNFSNIVKENDINNLFYGRYGHKMFYFNNTKEFITISTLDLCKKFIIVYNNDLAINYKGILDLGQCGESGLNNIFYDESDYSLVIDSWETQGSKAISIKDIDFTPLQIINPSTIPSSQKINIITDTINSDISKKITNKIITNEPIIITTEPIIITTEPTFITNEPTIITTESTIITTESKIITPEPTIITTELKVITTEPTITTTEQEIITTEPTIITTEPTIINTESTIITTELTIITTEPKIITTEPTIITTEPNIITNKPTITTTEPTIITTELTIITTEPTIITTEPIITTTEPTIITTEPTITTTEPTIITHEPTIYINEFTMNILDTTIISTEIENKNYTQNIKCKTSNYQSYINNLCLECNINKGYFPAEYPDKSFLHGFTECYNSTTKPINFYFDDENKKYKPCYETCLTCNEGGNSERHNCLSCDANLRNEPDKNSTNCITECDYYYYYSPYGQYKCTNNSICPDEANLYIKKLKKCTNDCSKEKSEYKYQYGGQCLDECPSGTSNDSKGLCINENYNSCSKSKREIDLQDFLTNGGVDSNAKNYANEFHYTKKHVSYFYNNIYSIFLYKDSACINELYLNIPKVDFGNCYVKVQQNLEPPSNDSIIIALIERANGQKKSSTSYFFYHPETGKKLEAETICKDEEVTIKESVLSQLKNSSVDLNSVLFLAQQDINIFNLSDEFYTDICYNFVSPNGKDVPLNDRIKAFYPNITLCESGCTCKGVDLDTMESICECKFND